MHDAAFMLFDGSVGDQVKSESIHLAFLAFVGGANLVVGVIAFLLRRDIKRSDAEKAKLGLQVAVLDERLDVIEHRHGCEISDVKIAVAPLFTQAKLPSPQYPTR